MPISLQLNVIQVTGTGMIIRVYRLNEEFFKAKDNVLYLYGNDGDQYFAFEVSGWKLRTVHQVSEAITWYANHIRRPEMIITLVDGRPIPVLRLVAGG